MVDIETSGINPGRHAMIQLSCVPFDLKAQVICERYFDGYLTMPAWRSFSIDTLNWWLTNNKNVYDHICANQSGIVQNLINFAEFVNSLKSTDVPNFWCRRPFDWMFVESYFTDFEVPCPFNYKNVIEMTSFLKGTILDDCSPLVDIPFEGEKHHAYWDCRHQIKTVFAAINQVAD
jgi:DNA polymerase III epsilon subunit-like protein